MSGQRAPIWPADKPLALTLNSFGPRAEEQAAQGTFDESSPLKSGKPTPKLFQEVRLPVTKSLVLKNAVVVSPMCQYSAVDGFVTPYHLAHLGAFAIHGAGSIMVEASAVQDIGRITPEDLGIWKDEHVAGHTSLVSALKTFSRHLTVGIQLAHAGRKASDWSPFYKGKRQNIVYPTKDEGGWPDEVVAPSALPHSADGHIVPKELSTQGVKDVQRAFVEAARRAFDAGYDFVELHAAHGYLFHEFLSPIANRRTDEYGGSFENRVRLLVDSVREIRATFPDRSVWVRVSGSDFAEHLPDPSWTIEQTQDLAKILSELGVDVLDISGGGITADQRIKPKPGYQIPFAKAVSSLKLEKPLVATVGRLESGEYAGELAEQTLQEGDASLILLARGLLTKPSWVEEAAEKLVGQVTTQNPQYHRALSVREVERSQRDAQRL